MAILDLFNCQVLVGNKALNEYDDDDEEHKHPIDQNIIKKYIEADSGANFAIKVVIEPGFNFEEADFLSMIIILDGEVKDCPVVEKELHAEPEGKTYFVTSVGTEYNNGAKWFLRKFRFGDIKTARYDELGSIKVEIWRMTTLSTGGDLSEAESKPVGVIPEKDIKGRALTLTASLGEPEVTEGCKVVDGEEVDVDPVAVFEFKYRSKESLKQLLIIPRTPSPTPLEERPLEDLSIEEARELLRCKKAEVEAIKICIKKERAGTNLRTPPAVKRFHKDTGIDEENEVEVIAERSAHKKQRPSAGQEVIDLSD